MSFTSGSRLGLYENLAPLGAGGMGEVYRARDTNLGREVAVKVLPEIFSRDEDKLARFRREAHLLASLNHPNIATIHGFEESNGQHFLVMELVEGETLAERLTHGPMFAEEALPLFQHIAEGLEAAHEKGIIHRDLKPSNIKIAPDGKPKILDFGLAKALAAEAVVKDLSQSPTLTRDATETGVLLGTAPYMSPEQARGKPVDKRTDIWAFGCCLYEALTGKAAFLGETVSDTIAAVLKNEPDWGALPATTPTIIRSLLRRSLQKDKAHRLHDIADARVEIEEARAEPTDGFSRQPLAVSASTSRIRERVAWGLAILAVALVTGITVSSVMRPGLRPPTRLAINIPSSDRIPERGNIALSPNGRDVVYMGRRNGVTQLYRRSTDQLEAVPLRGTEGAEDPFFSPDGAWVGFFSDNKIKKVSLAGGRPAVVCDCNPDHSHGASWGPDDVIVFAANEYSGLTKVSASGGAPEPVTNLGNEEGWHFRPAFLPGGKAILFTVALDSGARGGWVAVQSLATGQRRKLVDGTHARYAPTGHIVFARADSLWAVPFDSERLEVTGKPRPVLEGVQAPGDGVSNFALGSDGSLVYVPGGAGAEVKTLVWVDRQGREEPVGAPPRQYGRPRVSPDGTRLAVEVRDPGGLDVWIYELARGTFTRLTVDEADDSRPLWTPNGERVVFSSAREGVGNLFWRTADATGPVERLTTSPNHQSANAWAGDGQQLVFMEQRRPPDIMVLTMEGERTVEPLIETPFSEGIPAVSPDGRWIAYYSTESGRPEIYVQPFPDLDGKYPISTAGGISPLWGPDGRELFYRDGQGQAVLAVPIDTEGGFAAGTPEVLFKGPYLPEAPARQYDLAPDGRFLMIKTATEGSAQAIILVQNWFEELKRLVPTE